MWRLADYQGQMIANLIVAAQRAPERARRFRACWPSGGAARASRGVVASDRHRLEVNYYDYRRQLKRLIRRFGPVRKMNLGSKPSPRTPEVFPPPCGEGGAKRRVGETAAIVTYPHP